MQSSRALPNIGLSYMCGWHPLKSLMHACRLPEAAPEVAHASHTKLPRRGEQWRQSADVTAFLQKGHVHFADSVRFHHRRLESRVSQFPVFAMAELGRATVNQLKSTGARTATCVCTDGYAYMTGLVQWCQNAVG